MKVYKIEVHYTVGNGNVRVYEYNTIGSIPNYTQIRKTVIQHDNNIEDTYFIKIVELHIVRLDEQTITKAINNI